MLFSRGAVAVFVKPKSQKSDFDLDWCYHPRGLVIGHLSLSPLRSAWQPTSSVDTDTGRAGDLKMETVIIIKYHEDLTLTRWGRGSGGWRGPWCWSRASPRPRGPCRPSPGSLGRLSPLSGTSPACHQASMSLHIFQSRHMLLCDRPRWIMPNFIIFSSTSRYKIYLFVIVKEPPYQWCFPHSSFPHHTYPACV